MKDKLKTIKINLILLLKMIEEGQWSDEVNYSSFQKLEKINEKLGEVEVLIKEMESLTPNPSPKERGVIESGFSGSCRIRRDTSGFVLRTTP